MLPVPSVTPAVSIMITASTHYLQRDGQAELACVARLNANKGYPLMVNHFSTGTNLHLMMLLLL